MNKADIINVIKNKYGAEAEYIFQYSSVKDELNYLDFCDRVGNEEFHYRYGLERIVREADNRINPFNIKVGDGVTVCLYSDRYAATVTKVTKATVTVKRDKATLDPNFKPEFVVGGFVAHCTNQEEQTYTYETDPDGEEYTFRWSKKYGRYGQPNDLHLIKGRHEFYDYNF